MTTTVINTASPNAVVKSNQKKIDRTSNGTLWVCIWNGSASTTNRCLEFWYSTNDGESWTEDINAGLVFTGSTHGAIPGASIFIDEDDYMHVIYRDRNDSLLYYVRGTPNGSHTAWTWGTVTEISNGSTGFTQPDHVACRTPNSSPQTWDVLVVAADSTNIAYQRIRIANDGSITIGNIDGLDPLNVVWGNLGASTTAQPTPTIDFHHNGDAKTTKDGAPHLFVAWGGGGNINFRKAESFFLSGSWGWDNPTQTLASVDFVGVSWVSCLFDGERVVVVSYTLYSGVESLILMERDVADTETTFSVLMNTGLTSDRLVLGAFTYDAAKNLHIVGTNTNEASGNYDFVHRMWNRSTNLLGSETVIDADVATGESSFKRGSSNGRCELVYGDTNPASVVYHSILLPPSPPSLIAPESDTTIDMSAGYTFDWTHDNTYGAQSHYKFRRRTFG